MVRPGERGTTSFPLKRPKIPTTRTLDNSKRLTQRDRFGVKAVDCFLSGSSSAQGRIG